MQPIYFYTQDFKFLGWLKKVLKRLLRPGLISGPEGVSRSLFTGLKELGVPFYINKKITQSQAPVAAALSGVPALDWLIRQKQKGLVRSIVAGPNLVISPEEKGGILKNPLIDKIVVPSPWVKDFYVRLAPELKEKIYVWPAGVSAPEVLQEHKQYDFLVYNKTGGDRLASHIREFLTANSYSYVSIDYGKISQTNYFNLLDRSRYLIYMSSSESQGLAMLEAWARNVPTFVWDKGYYQHGVVKITGNVSSPYLSSAAGQRFVNFEDFKSRLTDFLAAEFQPRDYVMKNFTHKICAQKYLDIINA